jgi:Domain of unknown function (DUF397)
MTDSGLSSIVWRKSKRSDVTGCVEVAYMKGSVLVRDSKDPDGPVLEFSTRAWNTFITSMQRVLPDD